MDLFLLYSFGPEKIGITFEQAVDWLMKNEELLENIRKQIKS